MNKILGLDLGSSSIGWALRNEDNSYKTGVITFDSGMVKGTGGYTSPTKERREARSKRRLLQARKYRKWALLELLIDNKMVPLETEALEKWSKYKKGESRKFPESDLFRKWVACDFTYEGGTKYKNPYELRVLSLDSKISDHEFGRALYHLVQRRGYKNIGESDTDDLNIDEAKKDTETKKQLEKREKGGLSIALQSNRTVGEALKNTFLDNAKRARDQYPLRKEYRSELEQICKAQGFNVTRDQMGVYTDPVVQKLWKAIIWQRPLRSQKGNIGRCTLEKSRQRCASSHPLFEIFRSWQFINTIKYGIDKKDFAFLDNGVRHKLYSNFFLKKEKNIKFSDVRKFINKELKEEYQYNYKDDHSIATMPVCSGLIEIFGLTISDQIDNLHKYIIGGTAKNDNKSVQAPKVIENKYSVFDLWHILYNCDEAYLTKFANQKLNIENKTTSKGRSYNPFTELRKRIGSSFSDLSVKSISKIIPFLIDGHMYNEAVVLAKVPELLNNDWLTKREVVLSSIAQANKIYSWQKLIAGITNNLIDHWKGLSHTDKFAYKDTSYLLKDDDILSISKACLTYYGEKTWASKQEEEKVKIELAVKEKYQQFFSTENRTYIESDTLSLLLEKEFKTQNILVAASQLYHHSKQETKYKAPLIDKKTNLKILNVPLIDSIKNPMFNKSLCVLRKLLNDLIKTSEIDERTEIVIEVARELNDNNKRLAIERYQREREGNRILYRKFLEEYKNDKEININVDERVKDFELWNEQNMTKIKIRDESSGKEKEIPLRDYILKQKDDLKRYELWVEQKGICMYTGKLISIATLFSNDIDIEHTIPRSLLPDNTLANQTVCYATYNRNKKKKQLPIQCLNYFTEVEGWGTPIADRLKYWLEIKDHYEKIYEDYKKAKPGEDEESKNKRIQNRHYYKQHLDYWEDKINRFTFEEIKENWVRRQLTDTQLISKYAREYLSTYFLKVRVQKGIITSEFRKIYSFQEVDEIKNRNKHTHHTIDAAVLTLIPTNSSYRDRLLKTMFEWDEQGKGQFTTTPFANFNSQNLIKEIENTVLAVNYQTDKILKRTFKKERNRGRLVYLKNTDGDLILDSAGNKIFKISNGDSIRTSLYKQTFLAKIKDVEKTEDGIPKRNEDGSWMFKKGKEEFFFAERVSIENAKKYINDIVDKNIRELVEAQKNSKVVKDHQENEIRHVRIKTTSGKQVKQRVNYTSKKDYKNYYYSGSGSLPYAAFLQNSNDGNIDREMIPISSADIGKMCKKFGKFNIHEFINENYSHYMKFNDKQLLKIGQRVIVLENDSDFLEKDKSELQINRLYTIIKFSDVDKNILLKYHLESRSNDVIDSGIKLIKDKIIREYEIQLNIPEVKEDMSIDSIAERKSKYEKEKFSFKSFKDYRLERLIEAIGFAEVKKIKNQLSEFSTYSADVGGKEIKPLLKLSKENWNFLIEGVDFDISIQGEIKWLNL
ncbi:MAG: type II CRISPR RNA-guided endonuclease Cas9 [Bacteroidota bacterium]